MADEVLPVPGRPALGRGAGPEVDRQERRSVAESAGMQGVGLVPLGGFVSLRDARRGRGGP